MPHITVEYSANLEAQISPRRLVDAIHRAALATGVFPIGGLRTRAERRDIYAVADGDPDNAFVAVVARIGEGRDTASRKRVAEELMAVLEAKPPKRSGPVAWASRSKSDGGRAGLTSGGRRQGWSAHPARLTSVAPGAGPGARSRPGAGPRWQQLVRFA